VRLAACGLGKTMKTALVTPFLRHLPLYPGSCLGYGAAVLEKRFDVDVLDLNAAIYYENRERLEKALAEVDRKQVAVDPLDLYPLYHDLLDQAGRAYAAVPWDRYQSVYITIPSWFVHVPTENVLALIQGIREQVPAMEISFFGNSLGSWTDEKALRAHRVRLVHLNRLFEPGRGREPVDYDALPTPRFARREHYVFDILPFRLKHGCPWGRCRFCSLSKGWNAGYRERAADRVIQELNELSDTYRPRMFICNDNAVSGANLLDFCRLMADLQAPWGGMARADLGGEEIVALGRSGCRILYFGLESGSDRVLERVHKGITAAQISDFIKRVWDNGIIPAPSLFVGAPGEAERDVEKTIEFLSAHKGCFEMVNVYPLAVTPASDYDRFREAPESSTLTRLWRVIAACTELGLKVCVGEQCAEYAMGRSAYLRTALP
jgi:hypothetical protein